MTETQTLLAELIDIWAGEDIDHPDFQRSDSLPCSKCGTVTETAVIVDGSSGEEIESRVCGECWIW